MPLKRAERLPFVQVAFNLANNGHLRQPVISGRPSKQRASQTRRLWLVELDACSGHLLRVSRQVGFACRFERNRPTIGPHLEHPSRLALKSTCRCQAGWTRETLLFANPAKLESGRQTTRDKRNSSAISRKLGRATVAVALTTWTDWPKGLSSSQHLASWLPANNLSDRQPKATGRNRCPLLASLI